MDEVNLQKFVHVLDLLDGLKRLLKEEEVVPLEAELPSQDFEGFGEVNAMLRSSMVPGAPGALTRQGTLANVRHRRQRLGAAKLTASTLSGGVRARSASSQARSEPRSEVVSDSEPVEASKPKAKFNLEPSDSESDVLKQIIRSVASSPSSGSELLQQLVSSSAEYHLNMAQAL